MKTTVLICALVALLGLAAASRVHREYADVEYGNGFTGKGMHSSIQTYLMRKGKREEEERPAYLAIRFVVPPDVHNDFIDEWMKMDKEMADEKGLDFQDLKKSTIDNIFFFHYAEWSNQRDMFRHFAEDKEWRDFTDFVDHNDIKWELQPLKNYGDQEDLMGDAERKMDRSAVAKAFKRREAAHVLIYYDVPPSVHEDFVDTWRDVAKDTIQEKGNQIYALRRLATTNNRWYTYGTWDSVRDYMDHFESKHLHHLRDFAADQGIVWFLTPLESVVKGGKREESSA